MSQDSKAEQAIYDALRQVAMIPRAKERDRICLTAMKLSAEIMGYKVVEDERCQ